MASGALFGSSSARSSSKNLVEFKAGKMYMKGKMVNPDKRKGLVYIYRSEDALIHFCWKDRSTGSVEDDLIIFPDDCEFKRVTQCTTGRVYILKFKTGKKFFFWLQEPKTDKDEEHCRKVNEMLNNPPAPGSSGGGGGAGSGVIPPELAAALGGSHAADGGLQNLLANMDQQQLLQLLSSAGGGGGGLGSMLGTARPATTQSVPSARAPSATPASTPAAPSAASPSQSSRSRPDTTSSSQQSIQLTDLQSILSTMNIPQQEQAQSVDLTQVLTHESMAPILANEEVQQRLKPFLPEGGSLLAKDFADISTTIQSPQFQQAAGVFSAAFQSGQLGPLMAQFGLGKEATEAANSGDLEAFAKALSKPATDEAAREKPKDEDENMSVD